MIKHLTAQDNLQEELKEGTVLIDFFATWCGPCMMLAPNIEDLDREIDIKVIKIDVDELSDIARQYRVMSIPLCLLYKDGKLVKSQLGYMPLNQLRDFVTK